MSGNEWKTIGFALDLIQGQGENLSHRKGLNGQREKIKFSKSSCQFYSFIILITTLYSMFLLGLYYLELILFLLNSAFNRNAMLNFDLLVQLSEHVFM